MLFAFEKAPRISLSCKLVPVQYREYQYGRFRIHELIGRALISVRTAISNTKVTDNCKLLLQLFSQITQMIYMCTNLAVLIGLQFLYISGLEKRAVPLSRTSRLSFRATDFSFSLTRKGTGTSKSSAN